MTDATELDEAAVRARVRDVLSRTPDHLLGVRDVNVNGAQVLRVLDEITRLRAALDEARADAAAANGALEAAPEILRLAEMSDQVGAWKARAEAAESALAAVRKAQRERRQALAMYAPGQNHALACHLDAIDDALGVGARACPTGCISCETAGRCWDCPCHVDHDNAALATPTTTDEGGER